MATFEELVASRKTWIEDVLKPWCQQAPLKELRKAEAEWTDIAGRAAPEMTLWTWAWSRFPDLVYEGISGVNETSEVEVTLQDGRRIVGFPDNRQSKQGQLVILGRSSQESTATEEQGPFPLDDIQSVTRLG